jgi:hypothetical protein
VSHCTDPNLGRLLAEYELGLLNPEEKDRFEQHSMVCDSCFAELDRMAAVGEVLLASDTVWGAVRAAAAETAAAPWYTALGRWLWPAGGPWLKPAVSLALVALLLPLAWRGWSPDAPDSRSRESYIRRAQPVVLTSLRDAIEPARVTVQPDADLILTFGFDLGSPGRPIDVTLLGPAGDTLYHLEEFRLSSTLMGQLSLETSGLESGTYSLLLHDAGLDGPFQSDTLWFEIMPPTLGR